MPDKVDIHKFMSVSDIIWAIGQEGSFGYNSYKKYGLPLYSYLPSVIFEFHLNYFLMKRCCQKEK